MSVYFIKPIGMRGPVKIGHTVSPDNRLSTLETWSPFALELLAEIDGGLDLERRFHRFFLSTHQRREWFDWSPELQDVIDSIEAGTFDPDILPPYDGKNILNPGNRTRRDEAEITRREYQGRVRVVSRQTGFDPQVWPFARNLNTDALDLFFAAPHLHGVPIDAPWALQARLLHMATVDGLSAHEVQIVHSSVDHPPQPRDVSHVR